MVREWLTSLAILAAVSMSRNEAEMKLAAYVPLLADRFDAAAFTTGSLQYVAARAIKGFPTYGELTAWLAEWWHDNRPLPPALPPPDLPPPRPEPTDEERAYIRARVLEAVAVLRSPASDPRDQRAEPRPRYLTPAQLDHLNPLPNGVKRHAEA
jgi:hypothetical protein